MVVFIVFEVLLVVVFIFVVLVLFVEVKPVVHPLGHWLAGAGLLEISRVLLVLKTEAIASVDTWEEGEQLDFIGARLDFDGLEGGIWSKVTYLRIVQDSRWNFPALPTLQLLCHLVWTRYFIRVPCI